MCGCNKQENCSINENASTDVTTEDSTGYPGGEVQQQYVMVNNVLYVYDDNGVVDALPAGYTECGTIEKVNNSNTPNENFEASRMDTGLSIYSKDDSSDIYVGNEQQRYRRLVKAEE